MLVILNLCLQIRCLGRAEMDATGGIETVPDGIGSEDGAAEGNALTLADPTSCRRARRRRRAGIARGIADGAVDGAALMVEMAEAEGMLEIEESGDTEGTTEGSALDTDADATAWRRRTYRLRAGNAETDGRTEGAADAGDETTDPLGAETTAV